MSQPKGPRAAKFMGNVEFVNFGQAVAKVGERVMDADKKAWLGLFAVMIAEIGLFVMQENLVLEFFDLANFEANFLLASDEILGPLFSGMKDVTGKNLLAFFIAASFIAVPVFLWYALLNGFDFLKAPPVKKAAASLFILMYAVIIASEFAMLWTRLTYTNPWEPQSQTNPELAALMGGLFVLINAGVAFWTAYAYHALKVRRPSYA